MGKSVATPARTVLFCLLLGGCARKAVPPGSSEEALTGDAPRALSPLETMRLYREHLKSRDTEKVRSLLARGLPDGTGREDLDAMVRHSRGWVGGSSDFAILEAREEGDIAIVIVNKFLKGGRETVDIDPIPLLRQEGKWKVVPHIMAVPKRRLEAVPSLYKWYKERKEQLKKQLIR